MRISVIVPAYNESEKITVTVSALKSTLPAAQVIVVDDCSTDDTATKVQGKGVALIRHRRNWGKTAAVCSGLARATGDVILLIDGDMGRHAREAAKLLVPIVSGGCDMVIGKFIHSAGGGFGLVRSLASYGILILTGQRLQAPLSGQRAAKREVLERCLPGTGGFGLETELTVRALKRGYVVKEVDTNFVHQGHGKTLQGFKHRGKQFLAVLGALFRGAAGWR
ncbi:MAG: glycosyltransferase family 2 protein [Firmicutes bacterium]|nr:glycosyltransferase family 2 protein [Bacillota bacterium]